MKRLFVAQHRTVFNEIVPKVRVFDEEKDGHPVVGQKYTWSDEAGDHEEVVTHVLNAYTSEYYQALCRLAGHHSIEPLDFVQSIVDMLIGPRSVRIA